MSLQLSDQYIVERTIDLVRKYYTFGEIAKMLGCGVGYLRMVLVRNNVVLQPSLSIQRIVQACLAHPQTIEEMAAQHELPISEIERIVNKYDLPYLEKPRPLPVQATQHLPGSLGKVEELRRRAEANEELWHPDDLDYYGCREGLSVKELRETVPCGLK